MVDRIAALEAELARLRSERDQLASELEIARHYRRAVEAAPVGMAGVSAVSGRYTFVNRAFAEFMGQPYDSLLTRDPYQVWSGGVEPSDFQTEQAGVGRLATGEISAFEVESRLIPSDGKQRWVRAYLTATEYANGRLGHLIVYLTDIDQERRAREEQAALQAQLQRAQKLEAVGALVGGIAHDFNNRLVIIMGYCEVLKSEFPEGGRLSEHVNTILSSAKGAAALTRQLLAYSRHQVLNREPFDLNKLIEQLRSLLKSVAGDRIELELSLGARRNVLGDSGQIEQVILNLALNARDAMAGSGDGKLDIETRDVVFRDGEVPEVAAGKYVALTVADNGSGIPEDLLPRIFEPFFTTKEIGQGTGLGLAMVDGIVRQSGGSTRVESRVGVGSRFTVYLPETDGRAPSVAPPGTDSAQTRRCFETVLVCDDDDGVREVLSGILKLRGYQLLSAQNGRDAIELARAHQGKIHLLLTDLAMPGLTGIELATALRSRDPELRVLYVSGYTQDADLVSLSLGPRTHFIAKPFLPGDLTRAVASILEAPEHSAGASSGDP
jgi:hypothetical protein